MINPPGMLATASRCGDDLKDIRTFTLRLILFGLVALVAGPLFAQQPAHTFYFGGDILTMEGKAPRYVEALAVKDGRIAFAGAISDAGSWKGPDTRVVNLAGRTLLPGFVDGLSHIFLHVAGQDWADLSSPPAGAVTDCNRHHQRDST